MSHPANERIQDNLIDRIAERREELEEVQYPDAYDIARDLSINPVRR